MDRDEQTSTSSQERICREYATGRGWEVIGVEIDKGRSAFKEGTRRPGLDRCMRLMREGAADTLVVWKLDRFVRSLTQFVDRRRELESHSAEFVSVTDGFDTTTAMGKAMLGIAVVFAELESGIKRDRARAWHDERRRAVTPPVGPRPYGYRRHASNQLTVDYVEAEVVQELVRRIIADESLSAIARDLNDRGEPVGNTRGTVWRQNTIKRVVTNPVVVGLREIDGVLRRGGWEPILERDEWDRVRTVLADPERRTSFTNERRWLLSGRIHCGRDGCGGVLRAANHKGGHRYTCTGKGCRLSVPAEAADLVVAEKVFGQLDPEAWERMRSAGAAPVVDVDRLDTELVELSEMYARGELSLAEWKVMRAGLTDRAAAVEVEPVDLPSFAAAVDGWDELPVGARLFVIEAYCADITAMPGVVGARSFDPARIRIEWR